MHRAFFSIENCCKYHCLFCFRKEEAGNSALPSWFLELVPAIKYDINNVSNWGKYVHLKLQWNPALRTLTIMDSFLGPPPYIFLKFDLLNKDTP